MQMADLETWYVVDEDGNYGVGFDRETAEQCYRDNINDEFPTNAHVFAVTLKVPMPEPIEVKAEVKPNGVVTVSVG